MYTSIIISDMADSLSYYLKLADFSSHGFSKPLLAESFSTLDDILCSRAVDLAIVEEGFCGIEFSALHERLLIANPRIEIIAVASSDSPIRERRVLSLGVLSYLHRPLAAATFSMILANALARIERGSKLFSEAYVKNTDLAIKKRHENLLLSLLLTSPKSLPDIFELAKKEGLRLSGDFFKVGYFTISSVDEDREKLICGLAEVLKKSFFLEILELSSSSFAILFSGSREELDLSLPAILREYLSAMKKISAVSFQFSLSKTYQDALDSFIAFSSAKEMLESFELMKKTTALSAKEVENAKIYINSILSIKSYSNFDEYESELSKALSKNELRLSLPALSYVFFTLTCVGFDSLMKNNTALATTFLTDTSDLFLGRRFRSELAKLLFYLGNSFNSENIKSPKNLSQEAIDYISRNFYDPNISVKSVSDHFHISQNYLSSILKKTFGESFVCVLIRLRMEKAKELLLSTKKKISQIATDVGFSDSHYFSFSFKKYFGVSPLDMRGGYYDEV